MLGNNSYYMSHVYDLGTNSSCTSESIESYCVKSFSNGSITPDGERYDASVATSSMSATVSYFMKTTG